MLPPLGVMKAKPIGRATNSWMRTESSPTYPRPSQCQTILAILT